MKSYSKVSQKSIEGLHRKVQENLLKEIEELAQVEVPKENEAAYIKKLSGKMNKLLYSSGVSHAGRERFLTKWGGNLEIQPSSHQKGLAITSTKQSSATVSTLKGMALSQQGIRTVLPKTYTKERAREKQRFETYLKEMEITGIKGKPLIFSWSQWDIIDSVLTTLESVGLSREEAIYRLADEMTNDDNGLLAEQLDNNLSDTKLKQKFIDRIREVRRGAIIEDLHNIARDLGEISAEAGISIDEKLLSKLNAVKDGEKLKTTQLVLLRKQAMKVSKDLIDKSGKGGGKII